MPAKALKVVPEAAGGLPVADGGAISVAVLKYSTTPVAGFKRPIEFTPENHILPSGPGVTSQITPSAANNFLSPVERLNSRIPSAVAHLTTDQMVPSGPNRGIPEMSL